MTNSAQAQSQATAHTENSAVDTCMARARTAQAQYANYSQQQVDEVVTAVAWAIMNPDNNRELAEMAVADTGLGVVEDKINKNHRKTLGLLRDIQGKKTVGVIKENPETGLTEIARPVGVVGAIVPSTNPAATPANKTLNALKGGNAIILAPSPKGQNTCQRLVALMHAELDRIGAPRDLVQHLPLPVNKADTQEMMQKVDLIVATGSQNNVRGAYSSGTPAIGVGAGNVVSIVDESADFSEAAAKIVTSKTFDNATSCSSENQLIVVDAAFDAMIEALAGEGAILLDDSDRNRVETTLFAGGHLNAKLIAKSASHIAQACKLEHSAIPTVRVLMVEGKGIGDDHPFSGEKLSPVLTLYRAADFAAAKQLATDILNYQGAGHSISLHSNKDERALELGLELPVCRVIVNQIHCYATGGNFDNGMPFSLSMGCGSWGGNSISDNMNYRHFLNTTRIVRTIPRNEPDVESLFADYWQKTGTTPQS